MKTIIEEIGSFLLLTASIFLLLHLDVRAEKLYYIGEQVMLDKKVCLYSSPGRKEYTIQRFVAIDQECKLVIETEEKTK